MRVIAIWESEQAWERFRAERLVPVIAALGGPSRPEPTFRDLRPQHLVFRSAGAAQPKRQKEDKDV